MYCSSLDQVLWDISCFNSFTNHLKIYPQLGYSLLTASSPGHGSLFYILEQELFRNGGEPITFIETPSYLIAIIFFAFLIISIGAEYAIDRTREALRHKPGLVAATNALLLEITLVGIISLLLTATADSVSSICVPYGSTTFDIWTSVANVQGCDCCLEKTFGVGFCFRAARKCGVVGDEFCNCDYPEQNVCPIFPGFNATLTSLFTDPNCTCAAEYVDTVQEAIEPFADILIEETACQAEYPDSADCGEGEAHLISKETLEQVHILLFLVAATHIIMSIIAIAIASYRAKLWKSWEEEGAEMVRAESEKPAVLALEEEVNDDAEAARDDDDDDGREQNQSVWWRRWLSQLKEVGKCFVIQMMHNAITKEQFQVMRATYIANHNIQDLDFNFMDAIRTEMESQLSKIVGIGLECWITLVLFILASGPIGWALSAFSLLALLFNIFLNTKLIHIVRQQGRSGGSKPAADEIAVWYRHPEWFRPPLRFLIFLCSLTYSIAMFFAWQFGSKSCYFENEFHVSGVHSYGVPLWLSFVFSFWIFFNTCVKTIPWYCVVTMLSETHKYSGSTVKEVLE